MLRQQLPRTAAAASLITAPLLGLVGRLRLAAATHRRPRADRRDQRPARPLVHLLAVHPAQHHHARARRARPDAPARPQPPDLGADRRQPGPARHPHRHRRRGTELMVWQMGAPGASLGQMAALVTRYNAAPGAALIFMIGGLATLSGTLLLSAGLWRAHAVPAWTAIAISDRHDRQHRRPVRQQRPDHDRQLRAAASSVRPHRVIVRSSPPGPSQTPRNHQASGQRAARSQLTNTPADVKAPPALATEGPASTGRSITIPNTEPRHQASAACHSPPHQA